MLAGATELPVIETPRVRLRWLEARDVDDLFATFSDPEAMRYWSRPPQRDRAESELLLAQIHDCFARRSLFQWGVAKRDDDRVIGTCTLSSLSAAHRRAELGFMLQRAHWGTGLMFEATTALLGFAFATLDLHRIEADVDPHNARSIALLLRHGFVREGLLRQRWWVNGEWQDAEIYGLLRTT